MKYLSHYTEEAQTKLFDSLGVFFAFSSKQFEEAKKPDTVYVSLGSGVICPKENTEKLIDGLQNIQKQGIALDLKENGKKAIIERELWNYETFYTWDIAQAVEALEQYGITRDEVKSRFDVLKHSEKVLNA